MDNIGTQHFPSLSAALSSLFGEGTQIETTNRISGGDINEAYGLTLTDGSCIFMNPIQRKTAPSLPQKPRGFAPLPGQKPLVRRKSLASGRTRRGAGIPFYCLSLFTEKAVPEIIGKNLRAVCPTCTGRQQPDWFQRENTDLHATTISAGAARLTRGMTVLRSFSGLSSGTAVSGGCPVF